MLDTLECNCGAKLTTDKGQGVCAGGDVAPWLQSVKPQREGAFLKRNTGCGRSFPGTRQARRGKWRNTGVGVQSLCAGICTASEGRAHSFPIRVACGPVTNAQGGSAIGRSATAYGRAQPMFLAKEVVTEGKPPWAIAGFTPGVLGGFLARQLSGNLELRRLRFEQADDLKTTQRSLGNEETTVVGELVDRE